MSMRPSHVAIGLSAAGLLAVSALLVTGCGGGLPTVSATISCTDSDTFSPIVLSVNAGDYIQWTNNDTDPHTVIADTANALLGGPNSDSAYPSGIPAGQSYQWMVPHYAQPGAVFYYHCRINGTAGNGSNIGTGMAGRIVVVAN